MHKCIVPFLLILLSHFCIDRHASKSAEERKEEEIKFKEVNEAYSILSDTKKRYRYDSGQDLEDMEFSGKFRFNLNGTHHNCGRPPQTSPVVSYYLVIKIWHFLLEVGLIQCYNQPRCLLGW